MTPKPFLAYLQRRALLSRAGLTFRTIDPNSPEAAARLRRMRGVLGNPDAEVTEADLNDMRTAALRPPWSLLDPIAEGMHNRLLKSAGPRDVERLQAVASGFLPTGIVNACCFGKGIQSGYVIALNYGLFHSIVLLNVALLAPHMTDELSDHAKESISPQGILRDLIRAAMNPSPEAYEAVERHYSYLNPESRALGLSGASLMLEFIYRHEAGHICNGDVDQGVASATVDFENDRIDYVKANHRREYAADKYALESYLGQSANSASAWATFSQVEAFFLFLEQIEKSRKNLASATHPPAMQRLRRLREMISKTWGADDFGYTKNLGISFERMFQGISV